MANGQLSIGGERRTIREDLLEATNRQLTFALDRERNLREQRDRLERELSQGGGYGRAKLDRPTGEPQFTVFALSADGARAAGVLNSADGARWSIVVFEVSADDRPKRVRSIDVGATRPGWPVLSADGRVLAALRARRGPAA